MVLLLLLCLMIFLFFCAGDYVAVSAAFIAAGSIYDLQQRKPGARAQTAPGNKMLYLSFYISANNRTPFTLASPYPLPVRPF